MQATIFDFGEMSNDRRVDARAARDELLQVSQQVFVRRARQVPRLELAHGALYHAILVTSH